MVIKKIKIFIRQLLLDHFNLYTVQDLRDYHEAGYKAGRLDEKHGRN